MGAERPATYAEFWPVYLRAHSRRGTRLLHLLGTLLALACLVGALLLGDWRYAALAPLVGYGLAWTGHVLIERNRPATFGHPVWSLVSDLRMLALASNGRLSAELQRHVPQLREQES